MLNRMQEYFIGKHLRSTDDVFERARITMMYRFSLMFAVLFVLPFISDILLNYNKLLVLHTFDMVTIIMFPFMMRWTKRFESLITLFFIMTAISSYAVFMMLNPDNMDLIGFVWIIFFSSLAALMLRGYKQWLFSLVIPWLPIVYVSINKLTDGAFIIQAIREENAGDPPAFLLIVPISLLTYAIFSHTQATGVARKQIVKQKTEIENKNKDITDSINYARHIQDALLPDTDLILHELKQSAIYYRPKAIVAGDFYWMETKGDLVFIAACDCTGHGVPGAMVSVICSSALTRSIREFSITETGKILDKTRLLVIETFGTNKGQINDGMDISLLCINKASGEVTWSGANNPLWICNGSEMKIIKGDKQPVGYSVNERPFTTHKHSIISGEAVYLFTDGLADQFGGPDGKKLRQKPVQELLLAHHGKTSEERLKKVDELFHSWKGNLEQVDDICMIAISFS